MSKQFKTLASSINVVIYYYIHGVGWGGRGGWGGGGVGVL